jgi:hypothetical protein
MTILGERPKDTCSVYATTGAREPCPNPLHPPTATPARDWVSVSPSRCCDMLRYVAVRKTQVLGHPRRGAPTVRAYSGAGTSTRWLYSTARPQGNFRGFRGSQSNSWRAHDGPSQPQVCIKPAFLLCYRHSFVPPCTLPCGLHLPQSLPWLLGCSVAFSIPRTPYMAP